MTDQPSRGDIQPDSRGSDRVGTTGGDLRAQREALGQDLADVSEILRIRLDFLKALEAGDYDALPGAAYAIGFVRSYARHLGMDADRVAWQFKMELSGESPTAKLDFLTPVQESRIPRGAIVLVAVLLAVTIYGVWYYMNARDLTFADIIPEVPSQFGRTAEAPAPVAGGGGPAEDATAKPSSAEPPAKGAAPPEAKSVGSATAPNSVARSAPPPSEAAMGGEPANAPRPAKPGPPAAVPAPAEPPAAATEPAPDEKTIAKTPPTVPVEPPPQPAAPAETAAVASPPPIEPAPGKVPSRIEIRAKADSWVQVRTGDGTLLMTRIVNKGTSFVLPPQEGMKLTTGNAGGLEILVDGVVVPALGPFGAVRRDVAMDPERLKAGTALAR